MAGRDAIAEWAKLCYGWLGRAPDYKAAFLGTLGANAEFYSPWQENAKRWYRFAQERVPFVNHAIIHPPVDRNRPPQEVGDVYCHVEKETDAGIVVSGAKVVATGSALTNYTFVAHHGLIPVGDKSFAAIFMIPTGAPGVKLICRPSYEMTSTVMGSPFDYPLSSRIDENDAVFIMDKVLVPWENVFCYGDVDKANNFFPQTGFLPRALLHGCTRLAVKLDFIAGALLKAVEATGSKDFRGVQANVGEVLVWRNLFWGLSGGHGAQPEAVDRRVSAARHRAGRRLPDHLDHGLHQDQVHHRADGGLGADLPQQPRARLQEPGDPSLSRQVHARLQRLQRGRSREALKLLWDSMGTEFAGRHELYEINYGGSTEEIRRYVLFGAQAMGIADKLKGFVEQCMSEYDLDGWKVPDLTNPGELSYHATGTRPRPPASVRPCRRRNPPQGRRAPARRCSAAMGAASATRSPPSRTQIGR